MAGPDALAEYFQPVNDDLDYNAVPQDNCWGNYIDTYYKNQFPNWQKADLALITFNNASNKEKDIAWTQSFRESLYSLQKGEHPLNITDLGQIDASRGKSKISTVISQLIQQQVLPLIISPGITPLHGLCQVAFDQQQLVNLTYCDETFPFQKKQTTHSSPNMHPLLFEKEALLHYNHVGYQSYFVAPAVFKALEEHHYDHYRLGAIRHNFKRIEPVLRDSHILSFNVNAIRHADIPAHASAGPNGFYADEACQIARYAGISDALKIYHLCGCQFQHKSKRPSMQLLAQMIWYVVEGFYHRQNEQPTEEKENYVKYFVQPGESINDVAELVFWKSEKSGRWWLEVPFPGTSHQNTPYLMPCAYEDYQKANEGELPDRWLKAYQRLNYLSEGS